MDLGTIGLITGLILLMALAMRGMNLFLAAPISAIYIALMNGMALFSETGSTAANFSDSFLLGFSSFLKVWFLVFFLGALFGKAMEYSGSAEAIANWIIKRVGEDKAATAVVLACGVLTYGGVSVFVVAFAVYPLAVNMFRRANLPHRFIPAALALGSATFTMTSAGSMEIQNWLPVKHLGTTPYAAWPVSLFTAVIMAVLGILWLNRMIKKSVANREVFALPEKSMMNAGTKEDEQAKDLPSPYIGFLALLGVFATAFFFHDIYGNNALVIALAVGLMIIIAACYKQLTPYFQAISSEGSTGALVAAGNTSAVVGFGMVVKQTAAFSAAVDMVTALPGSPLISAAIAVTVIAGITGSASGGQTIALPILAPIYLGLETPSGEPAVNKDHLHRVISLSSGVLDSLPHNGYVVTLIHAICGESHKSAYGALAKMTMVVPALCAIGALLILSML